MSADSTSDLNTRDLSSVSFSPASTSVADEPMVAPPTLVEEHNSETQNSSLPKFTRAITETTHIMTFRYNPGTTSNKRKPWKVAPAPPGHLECGVLEATNTGFDNFPVVDIKAKDARTLEGIKSGKYYSMVHQFPDVLAKHGRGPINLNRETGKMNHANGVFIPLTQRGHERIAEHNKKMEEKAIEEGLRRRSSLRKLWDSLATKNPQEKKTTKTPNPRPVSSPAVATNVSNTSTNVNTAAAATASQNGNISGNSTRSAGAALENSYLSQGHQPQQAAGQADMNGVGQGRDEESPIYEEESGRKKNGDRSSRFDIDEGTCSRLQRGNIATSVSGVNTDGSIDARCVLQKQAAVVSDKTFKVPTRMQNAFLSNKGSELSIEANNNAIEAA